MKKFLIYLISILVVVAIGFTVFFCVRDEERISISASTMYVDINDTFKIDVVIENKKSYTTVEVSSEVPSVVSYDKDTNTFTAVGGGFARLRFKTNNVKFRNLVCDVYVGDGTKSSPFYIRSAKQLASIGVEKVEDPEDPTILNDKYPLDAYYKLASNIDLSTHNNGYWQPIGSVGVAESAVFGGELDGNGYSIIGMNINMDQMNAELETLQTAPEVGLFAKLGAGAKVSNLKFEYASIDGQYQKGGLVAGISTGATIERVRANDVYINNATTENSYVGGFVGYQTTAVGSLLNENTGEVTNYSYIPKVDRCSITGLKMGHRLNPEDGMTDIDGNLSGVVGGLVGFNQGGTVVFSYVSDAYLLVEKVEGVTTIAGGLVGYVTHYGENIINSADYFGGHVKDCYASIDCDGVADYYGQAIGYYNPEYITISLGDGTVEKVTNKVYGVIYNSDLGTVSDKAIGNDFDDQTAMVDAKYVAYGLSTVEMQNAVNYVSYVKEVGGNEATYRWAFNDIWFMEGEEVNHGFPILDYSKKAVSYGISDISDASTVSTVNDLLNIDPTKDYVLVQDLVIDNSAIEWNGIDNFSGKFYTAQKEDGTYYTIRFKTTEDSPIFNTITADGEVHDLHLVDSTFENLTIDYFGMIANVNNGIIQNAVIDSCSITGSMTVGAVAGHNLGGVVGSVVEIDNAMVYTYTEVINSNVYIKAGSADIAVGGVVGDNEGGTIRFVRVTSTSVEVKAESKTDAEGNPVATTFGGAKVGGVVGYSWEGYVEDAVVENGKAQNVIKAADGIKDIIIGGIAGETSGRLIDCYVYATISSNYQYENVEAYNVRAYAGGIAGSIFGDPEKLDNGFATHMENCGFVGGNISGYYAGGLAGQVAVGTNPPRELTQDFFEYWKGTGHNAVSSNDAPIDIANCYANGGISGQYVGGLASYVINGRMANCYANASLKGKADTAQKAGLVALANFQFAEDNNYAGTIVEYCYSNCEFDTTGSNYALATGNFRKSSFKEFITLGPARQDGFFLKCIYNVDAENASEARLPSSDDFANFVIGSNVINLNTKDFFADFQKNWNNWFGTDVEFAEAFVGDYNKIVCSNGEMVGTNPSAFISKNSYDQSVWTFVEGGTPELKACRYYTTERLENGGYKLIEK